MAINFIFFKDVDEELVRTWRVTEFLTWNNANDVVDELFELPLSRYQICLETLMTGNYFIFSSVHVLYGKCHNKSFQRSRSNIESPDWIKNRTTINPKNKDDKCFQYTAMIALNYGVTELHP